MVKPLQKFNFHHWRQLKINIIITLLNFITVNLLSLLKEECLIEKIILWNKVAFASLLRQCILSWTVSFVLERSTPGLPSDADVFLRFEFRGWQSWDVLRERNFEWIVSPAPFSNRLVAKTFERSFLQRSPSSIDHRRFVVQRGILVNRCPQISEFATVLW